MTRTSSASAADNGGSNFGIGARQQRLARARRADHEQVVAAGQGDLQRPAGMSLAANLGQVDLGQAAHQRGIGPGSRGLTLPVDRQRRAAAVLDRPFCRAGLR